MGPLAKCWNCQKPLTPAQEAKIAEERRTCDQRILMFALKLLFPLRSKL